MTDLSIDGEVFRVEVEGDPSRPVLLLSSALGADLTMWDAQMPAFSAHFRVVRYDPRGHGGSTSVGAPFSLAQLGADAIAILDALEIERAHFLGLSMGGAVGQWLLVHAPERIERAVLANTSARFGAPDVWNQRIRTVLAEGPEALADATMERWFSEDFHGSDADRVAAVSAVFRATSGEGYAGACAALRDMDMREALRSIERPVLIVTGRDDPVASAADIKTMLDAIGGARHLELDAKHISNIEAQAAFESAVITFLTAPLPARAGKARGPKLAKTVRPPAGTRRPAGRATAARSPLQRTHAVAPPKRRSRSADPARAAPKSARPKASPRKAARPAAARRVSPAAARTPVARAGAAASARKGPAAKAAAVTMTTPAGAATTKRSVGKRGGSAKAVPAGKTVSKKATPKKAIPKKAIPKKAIAKKTPVKKTPVKKMPVKKTAAKAAPAKAKVAAPAARRAARTRPGRPAGRGRR